MDYTARYPELAVLGRLPAGTVVDGELVVLRRGRANLPALLSRHQRRPPLLVSRAVVLKYTPTLRFVMDDSVLRGNRVLKIIEELEKSMPAASE